ENDRGAAGISSRPAASIQHRPPIAMHVIVAADVLVIGRADITEFLSLFAAPAEKLQEWLVFANNVFNRLEDLPVPTISA
ncbi:hypothetical protein, partial [Serratia sp. ME43]|uniref:hypothetical protein n=1 Tax=Serratia sp. ME43 TaxID=2744256 RepID=UPI0015F6C40E